MNAAEQLYQDAVDRVRVQYERVGYRPVETLPEFLQGMAEVPDLVLQRGNERLLVEVKAAGSAPRDWTALSNRLREHPEWGLDFVVVNPSESSMLVLGAPPSSTVLQNLKSSEELAAQGHLVAASLMAWAVFEVAARRRLFLEGDGDPRPAAGGALVRRLIHRGLLAQEDFAPMMTIVGKRNAAAHGAFDVVPTEDERMLLKDRILELLDGPERGAP